MKKIFLILLLPIGLTYGQQSPLIPEFKLNLPTLGSDNPKLQGYLRDIDPNSINNFGEAFKSSMPGIQVLRGRFSHRTLDGSSVYIMEPDNMVCLVPDRSKVEIMPGRSFRRNQPVEPMPNAGPRIELIPEIKSK